jgi:predicted ATP-binding protein involved in virulence
MKINNIHLTGLRAFSQAEFSFQPGMNLIVGVNGVGKTTVLEALRVCLAKILPEITISKGRKESFAITDIKIGMDVLQVDCGFEINESKFQLTVQKKKQGFVGNDSGDPRNQGIETPDIDAVIPAFSKDQLKISKSRAQPLGIYFSTRRSLAVDQKASTTASAGGIAAAFAESLSSNRDFNLRLIAQWIKVQETLAEENPKIIRHSTALREAIQTFLPEFKNPHVIETDAGVDFIVEKNDIPLNAFQLSDGERGMLSLVMDLAKRLSQANPDLEYPLRDGKAVVLIDELDLHLHPKWQRTIVENLTRTFPRCQFIATTHSPQIIGEVEPSRITIIDAKPHSPAISFGVDSSRVLEEILETPSRNKSVDEMLKKLYDYLDKEDLLSSKKILDQLKSILGPNDPEVTRSSTMISFLEDDLSDEANKKG